MTEEQPKKKKAKLFARGTYTKAIDPELVREAGFPDDVAFGDDELRVGDLLRYGQNPNTPAVVYVKQGLEKASLIGGEVVRAAKKGLSFINYTDAGNTLWVSQLLASMTMNSTNVVPGKHGIPCGVGWDEDLPTALEYAFRTDPKSIFGCTMFANGEVNLAFTQKARALFGKNPLEVIIGRTVTEEANTDMAENKKATRLLATGDGELALPDYSITPISGGYVITDVAASTAGFRQFLDAVKEERRDDEHLDSMVAGLCIARGIWGNPVVLIAPDGKHTYGIGSGQATVMDSLNLAIERAHTLYDGEGLKSIEGAVAVTDSILGADESKAIAEKLREHGLVSGMDLDVESQPKVFDFGGTKSTLESKPTTHSTYVTAGLDQPSLLTAPKTQAWPRNLSPQNYEDAQAAMQIVASIGDEDTPVVAHVSTHMPLGMGLDWNGNVEQAVEKSIKGDPREIKGRVIALNKEVNLAGIRLLGNTGAEVIVAPAYSPHVKEVVQTSYPHLTLIELDPAQAHMPEYDLVAMSGGLVAEKVQGTRILSADNLECITEAQMDESMVNPAIVAWKMTHETPSNGIVIVSPDGTHTYGIGGGQMNRHDSAKIAVRNALNVCGGGCLTDLKGAVLASDAFFPFPDAAEEGVKNGVGVVVYPTGSMNDQATLEMLNSYRAVGLCTRPDGPDTKAIERAFKKHFVVYKTGTR